MTAAELASILMDAATDALPYLAGGVGAGVVIFAVILGVRRAFAFFEVLGGMNSASPGGNVGAAWRHSRRDQW